MSERLSHDLKALLGDEGFLALLEAFAGTRLYIPKASDPDHRIVEAIGEAKACALAARYSPAVLRIPLARTFRARHYRAQGLSNARIATKLGLTETGVDKIFARMDEPPEKGSAQLSFGI